MKLDYSVHRIVIAPENEQDAAVIQRLCKGLPLQASLRQEGTTPYLTLESSPASVKPYEKSPGDLPLLTRLQERASQR